MASDDVAGAADLGLGHCLVCYCDLDLGKVTVNVIEAEISEESPFHIIIEDRDGFCHDKTKTDGTDSLPYEAFCKLLNLSPHATTKVLNDLRSFSSLAHIFCGQCSHGLTTVARIHEEISKLQAQIDSWRSKVVGQVKGFHLSSKNADTETRIDRLLNLIVTDLLNPNPVTETFEADQDLRTILESSEGSGTQCTFDEIRIKTETLELESGSDPRPAKFKFKNCTVVLQRLEDLPSPSLTSGRRRRNTKFHPNSVVTGRGNKQYRGPFKCTKCNLVFKTEHKQKMHMVSSHEVDGNDFPYSCPKCSKKFYSEAKLLQHLGRQGGQCRMLPLPEGSSVVVGLGSYKFKCNVCQLAVATKSRLQSHMQIHNKQRPYICDVCGESFALSFYLGRHQKWKHFTGPQSEHPFKCTVEGCGKIFSCSTTLKVHNLREHHKEFKFHCKQCDYKAVTIGKLNEHIERKHSKNKNPKSYHCQQCDTVFKRTDKLNLHTRKVHGPKEAAFSCKQCDKTFYEAYWLRRHELSSHTDQRPEICQVCGKGFALKQYLKVHMQSHRRLVDKRKIKRGLRKNKLLNQSERDAKKLPIIEVTPAVSQIIEIPHEVLELEVDNVPMAAMSVVQEVPLESLLTMQVESPYRVVFDEEFKMSNPILETQPVD